MIGVCCRAEFNKANRPDVPQNNNPSQRVSDSLDFVSRTAANLDTSRISAAFMHSRLLQHWRTKSNPGSPQSLVLLSFHQKQKSKIAIFAFLLSARNGTAGSPLRSHFYPKWAQYWTLPSLPPVERDSGDCGRFSLFWLMCCSSSPVWDITTQHRILPAFVTTLNMNTFAVVPRWKSKVLSPLCVDLVLVHRSFRHLWVMEPPPSVHTSLSLFFRSAISNLACVPKQLKVRTPIWCFYYNVGKWE